MRRRPELAALGNEAASVKTTCPYCGVGCGIVVTGTGDSIAVHGDPDHPANYGRLCSKGSALGETLGSEDRLLYPRVHGRRATWDEASRLIAEKFKQTIDSHGPDAVALYVSGQLLTEDYYVANKFMKGFVGSANIDTNSRLCMASSVAGHKRAFGSDTVPGCYEDLELADLIVLVGSNLAWCHPILYQRIAAAKTARPDMKIVVIDPRRTATCDLADLHLGLAPGGDVPLFQGLLHALEQGGARDRAFVDAHTAGVEAALRAAAAFDVERVARETGLAAADLIGFFRVFLTTDRTVTVYSQGVNQAADGTDKVNAIINCHLLTGRIGKPGMGPFSVTGQPNAMGGREVGGMANQLASHMALESAEDRARVRRFWNASTIAERPGLKAVDLFDAVCAGRIKAIWIMGTNPVVSMPNADRVREGLLQCDLVVVSDVVAHTDTAACAHILLPSSAWGEKAGMVTNSERRMSRQRSFLPPPGEARADWRQLCDVAQKMGWTEAFDFDSVDAVFREYARLCSFENAGTRDLDLSGVQDIDRAAYEAFLPTQWPIRLKNQPGAKRLFGEGQFFTPDSRARFVVPAVAVGSVDAVMPAAAVAPAGAVMPAGSYTLNTGRIRDQWHTMTRTGRAARLSRHISETFVEIAPTDAAREGLRDADIARVVSEYGSMLARVLITERQRPGSLFVPMHWTDQFAAQGRVDALVAPATDPISGQPALKSSRASIHRFAARWYGFAVLAGADFSEIKAPSGADYWAKARIDGGGARLEMAGAAGDLSVQHRALVDALLMNVLGAQVEHAQIAQLTDIAAGAYRYAAFADDLLVALIFLSKEQTLVARAWACEQVGRRFAPAERLGLLAGRPGDETPDRGAIVCACMNVGVNQIQAAIATGCGNVDAVGAATGAGTNCGSCRPDIRRLLVQAHARH